MARAASWTISLPVSRRLLERQVVVDQLELDPEQLGVEDADRLLEQLLTGLVALEDDDLQHAEAD